jgi:hypothetical protein
VPTDTELREPASQPPPTAPGDQTVAGPRGSRRRDAVIVVVALLVGMGAVAGFGALTGSDDAAPSATIDTDVGQATPLPDGGGSVAPGSPAASPQAAVEAFLDAEAAGDFDTSYELLSEAQRAAYGSAAAWTNAHADFFPVVGHRVVGTADGSVTAEVEYRSGLDEVVGLVPARGVVEWALVEEADGWSIDFDASAVTPVYPDDATAADAVAEWAAANQRCEEPVQYEGALVATADLIRTAESLCDTDGRIDAGPARTLDEFDASPLVSAFGTDSLAWARAVDLTGPAELTVAVAPIDDRWVVVGLLST